MFEFLCLPGCFRLRRHRTSQQHQSPASQVTSTSHGTLSETYDKSGNRITIEDPDHNITTYLYDNLYRLKQETNQLSQSRNYTYDANGNNLSITDRNGRVRKFAYDKL